MTNISNLWSRQLLALPANISLGWQVTNTLAYLSRVSVRMPY